MKNPKNHLILDDFLLEIAGALKKVLSRFSGYVRATSFSTEDQEPNSGENSLQTFGIVAIIPVFEVDAEMRKRATPCRSLRDGKNQIRRTH
jgi:hypothetical protein